MTNFTFTQEHLKRCQDHGAKWVFYDPQHNYRPYPFIANSFSPLAILTAWATDLLEGGLRVQWSFPSSVTHFNTGEWWDRYPTYEENLIDMYCNLWDEKQQKQPANEVVESVKRLDAEMQRLKKEVGI